MTGWIIILGVGSLILLLLGIRLVPTIPPPIVVYIERENTERGGCLGGVLALLALLALLSFLLPQ
jgi:hypothetical protein